MTSRAQNLESPHLRKGRTNGRACISCHERKVRCDILESGTPCSNCRNHEGRDCQLYEKKKTRASFTRKARHSNAAIQPRNQGHQALTAPATPVASTGSSWLDSPSNPVPRPSSAGLDGRPSSQQAGEDERDTRNLAEFLDREDVRVSEIPRCGRMYYIGTEFSNLNYLVRQRSQRPDQNVLHYGSHPLVAQLPPIAPEALELPTKGMADELIDAYFTHVNRGFPIVDEDDFMKVYRGEEISVRFRAPSSLLLLNAVLCVGAHVLAGRRREMVSLKNTFFERAKMLYENRFEKHREVYLQAALLMTWQCQGLEDIVLNSWHWVGTAARTALGMGMHRDATSSSLNPLDKQQWPRMWWILFQFDTMVSASQGRPQALNLQESDVKDLCVEHFEGVPNCRIEFTIWHTKLCVIFSETMGRRCSLRSTQAEKIEATKEADEALAQFVTSLPESLQLSLPNMDIWQATLHLTYNDYLILLHRPNPRRDPSSASPDPMCDLSVCFDAAATITSIFESLRAKGDLSKLWLVSLYVLFTATVFVSTQANSANPLMAAKSKRLYGSLILTLEEMSTRWIYAKSLLRLFNGSSASRPGSMHQWDRAGAHAPADVTATGGDDGAGFSLRPNPLQMASSVDPFRGGQQPGYGPAYWGQSGFEQEHGADMDSSSHATPMLGGPFGSTNMAMDVAGMDMLSVPSALESLLAGMGNDFDM